MPRRSQPGPGELVLMASVARRHYLAGRSNVEIAEELGLSRFKVARLLDAAVSTGLVRIEITSPAGVDVELSSRLQEAYGLRHAVVVDVDDPPVETLLPALGRAAADLVSEIVTDDDVLGLVWARSVSAMSAALRELAPCPVVQLSGALLAPGGGGDTGTELVRSVARVGGGPAYCFYAPMIVPDAATATALRRQPDVTRALEQLPRVTKAVVGVGAWAPGYSTVHDALPEPERARLYQRGVRAEVGGNLLDAEGGEVESPLTARLLSVGADQLRQVEEVVAVAYGVPKAAAVRAALRSGLVRGLVTHRALAVALLALEAGA
ncbi:transcriptional regulator [Motilibacter rhizosphaerae]|uniref:Transcriptional regulator n=1 Tax=Motilibacter rhizosphaerae TaxID=598652 RepID=A0A4Q7NFZ8_9ACTN|nr:sugar-binding domain-containing protein [Motilibacter rhizosphaerae]RZS82830.1 transcriptional regulator [Motilibacter rhizosphaerae]